MAQFVIIGGGASGVLLAAHLLREKDARSGVTLVEQRAELGAGIAYSTKDPDHLLNVRAANMSAFSDQPDHFVQWLRDRAGSETDAVPDASFFAPRHLYQDYLASLLAPHIGAGRLKIVNARAVSISERPGEAIVRFEDGGGISADRVVVATGNEGPRLPYAPWRYDGWTSSPVPDLPAGAPAAIIGTGLTMVDWVLTLLHSGHRGPIVAVSPRGLLPHPHRTVSPAPLDPATLPLGAPLSETMRWLRRWITRLEAEGGDWRSAIDALRPHTQRLWQALPLDARRRFLRHARPWWDQHRHRIAPAAAGKLEHARRSGQFSVVAGRVLAFEERAGGADVVVAIRGSRERRRIFARAVFECRGRTNNVHETENPLLRSLLATGQARSDPLNLGLDVSLDCALIDRDGAVSQRLHAIGPVTSGVFWEVTAVPDIRVQASNLAQKFLRGGAAGSSERRSRLASFPFRWRH
jgi:uncharacterized NAD(P)/FAD-binding protein YdhS